MISPDYADRQLAAALGRVASGLFILPLRHPDGETGMLAMLGAAVLFPSAPDYTGRQARTRHGQPTRPGRPIDPQVPEEGQTDMIAHFGKGFSLQEDALAARRHAPARWRSDPQRELGLPRCGSHRSHRRRRSRLDRRQCPRRAACSMKAIRWSTSARTDFTINKPQDEVLRILRGFLIKPWCQFCNRDAVSRCYACGDLVCDEHQGRENCYRCETAIAAGDRRADRIGAMPLGNNARPGWWRPIPAEDYEPPSCYECKGLARAVCRNCQSRYCPQHAGKHDLCAPANAPH